VLEAILGPIVGVQAHGERRGWVGLMLDHQVGRFSEASMSAMAVPEIFRADVEIFGRGAAAALDCTRASGPHAYRTMHREFVDAIRSGGTPVLDARHGLHLQRVIEAADGRPPRDVTDPAGVRSSAGRRRHGQPVADALDPLPTGVVGDADLALPDRRVEFQLGEQLSAGRPRRSGPWM
jgi:predicted dehydrogenase